ncbi:FAD-binding oxidoreductase [Metallosphaera tengchongensis]|uniref:FAD-binding oxidoreductase n=1 Tax=Metallosphaera tengchongensis TaxID=1532350 RepID=A0A6N0NX16_9CREN|nr:FAD-dependent oxidoreductase [Metallosphaera tengchongensis]QKR00413.1 FAD-binding oxidoreductase [Metallosphaera tengchongensis]
MNRLVIFGGGITGLLTARYLQDAIVMDSEGRPRNSLASLWNVMPGLCGDLEDQCRESMMEYMKLCDELGVEYKELNLLRVPPRGNKVLSPNETRELEPKLHQESEDLGKVLHVNGEKLLSKLSTKVVKAELKSVELEKNRVTKAVTDIGEVQAEQYVFALGYDRMKLLKSLVDVKPYKGHVIKTPPLGMKNVLLLEDRLGVEGFGYTLLNGDSYPSEEEKIDKGQVEKTLEVFSRYLGLKVNPVEVRVGFRAVSGDGKPVITRLENAIVVTGYRFGWALAPVLAKKVKSMLR